MKEFTCKRCAKTFKAKPVEKAADHRLFVGDSTDKADVELVMKGAKAGLFSTDPPYVVNYTGADHPRSKSNINKKGQVRQIDWSDTYHEQDIDGDGSKFYDHFIKVAVSSAIRPNAAWYCWHASRRQRMVEDIWNKNGAIAHQQIIWHKSRPVLTYSAYMWDHEPCLMGWLKGNKPTIKMDYAPGEWPRTVFDIPSSEVESKDHPTSKPVKLFSIPIEMHLRPGEIAYEPFAGSGTQFVAAEQTGRLCYGLEIEPKFCAVILERLSGLGLEPHLA